MKVLSRSVPARTVAVISREIAFEELEEYVSAGFAALFQWAQLNPGVRGLYPTPEEPTMVVFLAPLEPEQRAVVELGAVVSADAVAADAVAESGIELRVEPAHEQAYVTLAKEEIEFPRILTAYEAVAEWVAEHGEMIESMPTRELYFTDVMAASARDSVCDIASAYVPR